MLNQIFQNGRLTLEIVINMTHKKIRFKGELYWLNIDAGITNISPLDHYDAKGNLLANPLRDISYAVVFGTSIVRYRRVIGKYPDDIEYVED